MADELVDVDTGVETDDVEAPERLGGPARPRRRRSSASWAADDSEDLAGVGDGDETGGTGERRPDRLVVAHLEIADVDGDPGAVR